MKKGIIDKLCRFVIWDVGIALFSALLPYDLELMWWKTSAVCNFYLLVASLGRVDAVKLWNLIETFAATIARKMPCDNLQEGIELSDTTLKSLKT